MKERLEQILRVLNDVGALNGENGITFDDLDRARENAHVLLNDLGHPAAHVIRLEPALTSMEVLAVGKDAVYLRLPKELQRDCGGCSCQECKTETDPDRRGKWDTLAVPLKTYKPGRKYLDYHSWTVHCPNARVKPLQDHLDKAK